MCNVIFNIYFLCYVCNVMCHVRGKMSNSPRGEAQVYPKLQDELFNYPVRSLGAGSNVIYVSSKDVCIAWGVPVAGKLGLEGDAKSSAHPKLVDALRGKGIVSDVSCGFGHVAVVMRGASADQLLSLPVYPHQASIVNATAVKTSGVKRKAESTKAAKKAK